MLCSVWRRCVTRGLVRSIVPGRLGEPAASIPRKIGAGIRRTLKRRIRSWRALNGRDGDVLFRQEYPPGRLELTDFTAIGGLGVRIAGIRSMIASMIFVWLSRAGNSAMSFLAAKLRGVGRGFAERAIGAWRAALRCLSSRSPSTPDAPLLSINAHEGTREMTVFPLPAFLWRELSRRIALMHASAALRAELYHSLPPARARLRAQCRASFEGVARRSHLAG